MRRATHPILKMSRWPILPHLGGVKWVTCLLSKIIDHYLFQVKSYNALVKNEWPTISIEQKKCLMAKNIRLCDDFFENNGLASNHYIFIIKSLKNNGTRCLEREWALSHLLWPMGLDNKHISEFWWKLHDFSMVTHFTPHY